MHQNMIYSITNKPLRNVIYKIFNSITTISLKIEEKIDIDTIDTNPDYRMEKINKKLEKAENYYYKSLELEVKYPLYSNILQSITKALLTDIADTNRFERISYNNEYSYYKAQEHANFLLGVLNSEEKEYYKAYSRYKIASDNGHPYAVENLSLLLATGVPNFLEKDSIKAHKLFRKNIKHGNGYQSNMKNFKAYNYRNQIDFFKKLSHALEVPNLHNIKTNREELLISANILSDYLVSENKIEDAFEILEYIEDEEGLDRLRDKLEIINKEKPINDIMSPKEVIENYDNHYYDTKIKVNDLRVSHFTSKNEIK